MTQCALEGAFPYCGIATPPAVCWQPAPFASTHPIGPHPPPPREQGSFLLFALTLKGDFIIQETILSPLTTWQNFYVIIGAAAATLTGLMFVVVTLSASVRASGSSEGIATFSTPSVVYFCTALLVSAMLSAPWQALWQASLLLGLCGLAGITYAMIVIRRTLRQNAYQPVLEDWIWHATFPLVSYTTIFVAAIVLISNPVPALFGVGAAMVLLLFIGIHNAWDNVTYITVDLPKSQSQNKNQD